MKKRFGILLLISLLAPGCGTFLWVYVQKMQIREAVKEQMIEGMGEDDLVWLKFTQEQARSELRWEHDREFEYRRQMYDVVRSEVRGDTTYYLCWPDDAETELNRKLERLAADSAAKDSTHTLPYERLFDFFKSLYCSNVPTWREMPARTSRIDRRIALNYDALSYPPPVPPPRLA